MTTVLLTKSGNSKAEECAKRVRAAMASLNIEILPREQMAAADMVTAIGGDGTIMHAAKQAAAFDKPVLGINAGRVGFLADLQPNELDLLTRLNSGDYKIEARMLLSVSFSQNGRMVQTNALNEVAITRGGPARMMDIRVRESLSEQTLCYRADGLLAATPTGSTAYSLSAGGPVLDPLIEGIVLTPVCPYSLQSRSLVFSADHTLYVTPECREGGSIFACVDGEEPVNVTGQTVTIRKATDRQVRLIRLKTDPFFNAYKNKIIDRSV